MRTELEKYELIDQYILGKLSETEVAQFEERMRKDPELQKTVETQQDIIKATKRKALLAEINSISGMSGASIFTNSFWITTGLAFLVTIITIMLYYNKLVSSKTQQNTTKGQAIIANYTQTIAANPLTTETVIQKEQPETTFSTINKYEDTQEDLMSVTVNFEPRDRREAFEKEAETNTELENDLKEITKSKVIKNRSKQACFPGGNPSLKEFIDYNLNYPRTAKEKNLEGIVRVDFHVTAQGEIVDLDAQCIQMNYKDEAPFNEMKQFMNKKVENLFINNATHVLRTMPKWKTARDSDGNPILSHQRIYFKYDLDHGCSAYQLDE